MTENRSTYPVRVDASLDDRLSRGLWLVKWLLLIPHVVVLAFLWLGFVVLSVLAFFAILITGRYPRALFDYNLGVLRWTWRVQYYGYGALGTDRYPPFTLAEVPDYPAHLDVPYPERLSRGLVLVKWWLLALPHYIVVGIFVGGGLWLSTGGNGIGDNDWGFGGLVSLLVFIAGVVLLFSGRYPRPIYDFVLGMDRWVLRVAAYASLMTDAYPPFRMDMGGGDPGSVPPGPEPVGPAGGGALAVGGYPAGGAAQPAVPGSPGPAAGTASGSWSAGRVVTLVIGALLLVTSTGFLAGGGALLWADQTQREDGRLISGDADLRSTQYAVTTDNIRLEGEGLDWTVDEVLGTARLEVTPADPGDQLFIGLGRTAQVSRYLDGVGRSEMDHVAVRGSSGGAVLRGLDDTTGGPPPTSPADADVWTVSATGTGTQTLDWRPSEGAWTVVVMRADGAAGIDAEVRVGATLPGLTWFSAVLLGIGALLALTGALLIALAVHRSRPVPPQGGWPVQQVPPPRGPAGSEPLAGAHDSGATAPVVEGGSGTRPVGQP